MICKSRSIECEFWRRINNYNVPKKWVPCHSSSSTPINNSKSAHGSNIPSMCTLIHVAIHGLGRTIPEQTRFSVFLCTTYGEVVNSCLNVLSANVIPRNSLHNLQTPKNLCTCLFPIHRDNMGTERVQACRVENLFGGSLDVSCFKRDIKSVFFTPLYTVWGIFVRNCLQCTYLKQLLSFLGHENQVNVLDCI